MYMYKVALYVTTFYLNIPLKCYKYAKDDWTVFSRADEMFFFSPKCGV